MSVFNIISLFGGLAMFLYGMRLMGDNLKESSSGALKRFMEKVTNNPLKAFLLGLAMTAIIQSSTATIVITAGLVTAGVISLRQSLGIIIGANVGTTVTGQIIRFLGIDSNSTSFLRIFQPSTLAPVALIIGILCIVFLKFRNSKIIGNIAMGFGILFTGLMSMTTAVSVLSENGIIDRLFSQLGDRMWLSYLVGAGVAFMLQSSSATIGILQAFSLSGVIPFKVVFIMLLGIYLGDCVTTGIVCSVGAKPESRRVGLVNIFYNLSKSALTLIVVLILRLIGVIGPLWESHMNPGSIANTNTVFNLVCALALLPLIGIFERLSLRFVKEEEVPANKYQEQLDSLNPVFFHTPALAFNSCYNVMRLMLDSACESANRAMDMIYAFDEKVIHEIYEEEDNIDMLTDAVSTYLGQLAPYANEEHLLGILDQYNRDVSEFERLGDHAMNIAETAAGLQASGKRFTEDALEELNIVRELINRIFVHTKQAFEKRDMEAANEIEPLEEVMDDLINALHNNHLIRLRERRCTTKTGIYFLDLLTNLERISDICSNVALSIIVRVKPEIASTAHAYVTTLHQGEDENYERRYHDAHDEFFEKLTTIEAKYGIG